MELRQFRYFVRVVEAGSIGRAAMSLGMVTSALSQQISRLEGELATWRRQRSASGVAPVGADAEGGFAPPPSAPRGSVHVLAAVHGDIAAGHERRRVAADERH